MQSVFAFIYSIAGLWSTKKYWYFPSLVPTSHLSKQGRRSDPAAGPKVKRLCRSHCVPHFSQKSRFDLAVGTEKGGGTVGRTVCCSSLNKVVAVPWLSLCPGCLEKAAGVWSTKKCWYFSSLVPTSHLSKQGRRSDPAAGPKVKRLCRSHCVPNFSQQSRFDLAVGTEK